MWQKKNITCLIMPLLFLVGMPGCAQPPSATKMVPYVDYSRFRANVARTLSVVEVNTQGCVFEGPSDNLLITRESFEKAVVETLRKSGIFREISIRGKGDWELRVLLLSEKIIPGLTANVVLFAQYSVTDAQTGKVLLKESIVSQYNSYGGDPTNAVEGAARDNIQQFLMRLYKISAAYQAAKLSPGPALHG